MTIPLHIWFNRNYATIYWIIKDIQNRTLKGHAISVYATHIDATTPILQAADHVSLEPQNLSDAEYIDWCLQYCITHKINVMVPVHSQDKIMAAASRFDEIGVKLIAAPAEVVTLFEDKDVAYATVQKAGISVPPWKVADSSSTLREARAQFQKELPDIPLVVKPVSGVGGVGFYIIADLHLTAQGLMEYERNTISWDELIKAYEVSENTGSPTPKVMVLPYLAEPEISVDCLASPDGKLLRIAPRVKVGSRLTQFTLSYEKVIELTEKLVAEFNLQYVFNVQWRWYNDEPVLLEVNTRASGGLYSVLEYTGENFVWGAILLSLGVEMTPDLTSLRDGSYIPVETSVAAKLLPLLNT